MFEKNENNSKFRAGRFYGDRSIGDHNCIFYFYIVRRTKKSIWVVTDVRPRDITNAAWPLTAGTGARRGISEWDGAESCYPDGKHSMCTVLNSHRDLIVIVTNESGDKVPTRVSELPKSPDAVTVNEPEHGKTYRLTGAKGTPNIAAGNNWHESEVKPEKVEERIEALEGEGLTRSDAQGVVMAEDLKGEGLIHHAEWWNRGESGTADLTEEPKRTVKEMYHTLFNAAHLVLDGADKALSVGIGSPGHEPKGIEELRAAIAELEGK